MLCTTMVRVGGVSSLGCFSVMKVCTLCSPMLFALRKGGVCPISRKNEREVHCSLYIAIF